MTRNLKVLGLTVAALALSAVAASAAMAEPQGVLTTDGESVTLDIEEVGEPKENGLTAFGGETRCPGSTYTGHELNTTNPKNPVPNGATTVTLSPHYNQPACISVSGGSSFSQTIEMTSCDYVLHLGTTTGGENTYGATLDVDCNQGDAIHLTQFAGEAHGFRVCSITMPEQTGLSGLHLTDETNGHLRLHGTLTGTHLTRSGLCGAATEENGQLHINATVNGTDDEGNDTDIGISEEA